MQKEKTGLIYVYNAIDPESRNFLTEIESIELAMNGNVVVNRIDVYKSNGLALKLKLDKTPAIVITKNGDITDKIYTLDKGLIQSKL